MSDRIFLTPEQAESVLNPGKSIHTFRSAGSILMGCDWSRKEILELFRSKPVEIGGPQCKMMNHGLVVFTSANNPMFIECDSGKLKKLEDELTVKS